MGFSVLAARFGLSGLYGRLLALPGSCGRFWFWGPCLGALGLAALLTGFVPESQRTEIRRTFARDVITLTERPITHPLRHVRQSVRGSLDKTVQEVEEGVFAVGGPSRQLPLAGGGSQFKAAPDAAPLPPALLGAPLLPPGESHAVASIPRSGWNARLQSCDLSADALSTLRNTLTAWEEARDLRALQLQRRADPYSGVVQGYAAKYRLKPDLVFAIIYAESSFNPRLVSNRNALGLMQIVPGTAGGEVHAWLGRQGHPSSSDLLDPATNIRYGIAYLHLLSTRHLGDIDNPLSREYCAIASYNSGASAVLRVFGPDWSSAFAAINSLSPEEVRLRLLRDLPAKETRVFLDRVLSARDMFAIFNPEEAPL